MTYNAIFPPKIRYVDVALGKIKGKVFSKPGVKAYRCHFVGPGEGSSRLLEKGTERKHQREQKIRNFQNFERKDKLERSTKIFVTGFHKISVLFDFASEFSEILVG